MPLATTRLFCYSTGVMVSPEVNREAMVAIVGEEVNPKPRHTGKSAELRLRKRRKELFLSKASELLDTYPQTGEETVTDVQGRGRERLTRPIDVAVGDQTVQVQVIEISRGELDGYLEKWTGIQMTQPESRQRRLLFGIEQLSMKYPEQEKPTTNTHIGNRRRGAPASNEHVLRGLQAIDFIADQLAAQPYQTP